MKKLTVAVLIIILGYQYILKDSTFDFPLFIEVPALEQEISLLDQSPYNGKLIVINKDTKLQQNPTNLAVIPTDFATNVIVDSEYLIEEDVIEPLQHMFEAAKADGIEHFTINSAYRSDQLQQQLFEEKGENYALPAGYSEHQSGLSLDIGSTQGTMDKSSEGKWLAEYAAEFGFILRYPKNKVDVTGIAYEPWHFRYVGKPHSMIMKKKDLALEEYIDFLKEKKEYTKKIDEVTYLSQYAEQTDAIKIPDTKEYEVSGDNLNGYIITSVIR